MNHTCTRLFCLAALTFVLGCSGGSGLATAPVTGKVTYKGAPVEGARIAFIGASGTRSATGVSAADGTYKLTTVDTEGAMPGSYSVTVEKTETAESKPTTMEEAEKQGTNPSAAPKSLLPAKYADPAKTPLKFEVKSGSNEINLELAD